MYCFVTQLHAVNSIFSVGSVTVRYSLDEHTFTSCKFNRLWPLFFFFYPAQSMVLILGEYLLLTCLFVCHCLLKLSFLNLSQLVVDRSASVCLHSAWTMIFISSIVARLCVCVFWDIKLSPHKDAVIILNSVSDSSVTVCSVQRSLSPLSGIQQLTVCSWCMPFSLARSCSLYRPFSHFHVCKAESFNSRVKKLYPRQRETAVFKYLSGVTKQSKIISCYTTGWKQIFYGLRECI